MNIDQAKNSSRSFRIAANRCLEQRSNPDGTIEMPVVPAIVCLAFSIEVGLKTLLKSNNVQSPKTHQLFDLFSYLPVTIKDRIAHSVDPDRQAFESSLQGVSKVFEEWRYIYEKPNTSVNHQFLTSLADSIHSEFL